MCVCVCVCVLYTQITSSCSVSLGLPLLHVRAHAHTRIRTRAHTHTHARTHTHSCGVGFGLLVRRHHCRGCGQIFCNTCAPRNALEPRLCLSCRQVPRDTEPHTRDTEPHARGGGGGGGGGISCIQRDSEARNGDTEPHKIMPDKAYLLHSPPPLRPPPKLPALGMTARSGKCMYTYVLMYIRI